MNTRKTKMKIMAVLAVLAMMMVCIVPVNDSENGLDAAVGDGGTYSYTIQYDASAMSTSTATMSVADMTAISHTGSPTTLSQMNAGSWTWNTTTGYGPFNSFYAAFDLTDGNLFYAILNPYDLTKTVDGKTLTPLTNYNIMWVLPTVYIIMGTNGTTLTFTNDSTAGGHAYAHTIDGHTYKYIAYGVYEASTTTVDSKTVLTSTSGTTPAASQTRGTFRTYAHNYTMNSSLGDDAYSMQWNFDQWKLYQDICFAVMENTNSQNIVGNGHVYTSNSQYAYTTGALNTMGPYAGNPAQITDNTTAASYGSDSVKLFIENAWGGVWDFVDGIIINGKSGAYIDSSNTPNDGTSGTYITNISWTLPDSNYVTSIQTGSDRVWGFPGSTTTGGSATTGLADYIYTSTSSNRVLNVGGYASSDWSFSVRYGLSFANAGIGTSGSSSNFGSRLAFVFDADPASADPVNLTFGVDGSGYGTIGDGTQTGQTTITVADVTNGTTLTVSNNTLTIGDTIPTTITATPTTSDDHWTYAFDGWYIGTTKITTSTTVTEDTAINAKFTQTLTLHNAQVESNNTAWGTVSVGTLTDIPYGETFTVSSHTLTIYGQSVVAVESPDTVEFQYSFDGFETEGVKIVTGTQMLKDLTIRAIFTSSQLTYTVIIHSNNTDWGNVNVASITNVPGGSEFEVNSNSLKVAGTTVTATKHTDDAQYTYGFSGWYDALTGGTQVLTGSTVTDNMEVYARFTATTNSYAVSAESNDTSLGTVSPSTVSNIPYGTVATVNGNTITVNGSSIVAMPEEATESTTYRFVEWRVNGTPVSASYVIQANTTFTAVFTDEETYYQINFVSSNGEYGSVAPTFLGSITYGTVITATGNVLDVNGVPITATPVSDSAQYDAEFSNWTVGQNVISSYTVTGNVTIIANFTATVKSYTVTWKIGDTTETQTYEYGQMPTHADPEAPGGQEFKRWQPQITEVTEDVTYTAVFDKPHSTNDSLINMIPLLIVIAIVVAAVGGLFYSGGDPMVIIKLAIGLVVCIIVLVSLVIPVIGGI